MEIYKATRDKMLSVKCVRQQAGVLEERMERMCWSQQAAIGEKSDYTHTEQLILDTFLKTGGASKIYSGT